MKGFQNWNWNSSTGAWISWPSFSLMILCYQGFLVVLFFLISVLSTLYSWSFQWYMQWRKLLIVICVLCNCSGSDSGQMLSGVESMWPVLMIASSAFQAGASIIKVKQWTFVISSVVPFITKIINLDVAFEQEFVFVDAEARLKVWQCFFLLSN